MFIKCKKLGFMAASVTLALASNICSAWPESLNYTYDFESNHNEWDTFVETWGAAIINYQGVPRSGWYSGFVYAQPNAGAALARAVTLSWDWSNTSSWECKAGAYVNGSSGWFEMWDTGNWSTIWQGTGYHPASQGYRRVDTGYFEPNYPHLYMRYVVVSPSYATYGARVDDASINCQYMQYY